MAETLDISAVADAVASATAPPPPLPSGWILKPSSSFPSARYYYHMETGMSTWQPPIMEQQAPQGEEQDEDDEEQVRVRVPTLIFQQQKEEQNDREPEDSDDRALKRRKQPPSSGPKEVRVLHILKKHKGSRRPSSWRQPMITHTLQEAREELQGLRDILQEEEGNPEELRATFEELARTESDCSSAKRGGDLGFFGRRKMQPAFEEASFALKNGELTRDIVETSSGVHIILRIG